MVEEQIDDFLEENLTTKYFDKDSGIEYIIPENFSIDELGCITSKGSILSKFPTFINGIIVNVDKDIEKLRIQIKKNNVLKEGIFLKSLVYGSPITLSNFGIPITHNNKAEFIEYFSGLEQCNDENIPIVKTVSKLGWRQNNKIFVPQYDPENEFVIDEDNIQKTYIEAVIETSGTWQEWADKMREYRRRPLFRFILSTAFASPLLEIVGCRNFRSV